MIDNSKHLIVPIFYAAFLVTSFFSISFITFVYVSSQVTSDDLEKKTESGTGKVTEVEEGEKSKKQKMLSTPESTKLISKLSENKIEEVNTDDLKESSDRGSDAVEVSKGDGKKSEEKKANGRMDMFISKVSYLSNLLFPISLNLSRAHHIISRLFELS
jgi:hypothetical protein